jgi:DNA polymerase
VSKSILDQQIALVDPDLILALGGVSAKNLLRSDLSVGKLRGKKHLLPNSDKPVLVTYHPAYLLRSPSEKSKVWADLQILASDFM